MIWITHSEVKGVHCSLVPSEQESVASSISIWAHFESGNSFIMPLQQGFVLVAALIHDIRWSNLGWCLLGNDCLLFSPDAIQQDVIIVITGNNVHDASQDLFLWCAFSEC